MPTATILGFSPDGGVFAFEEFGVQDGSGFAYANVYMIDTERDAWVSGTPIRVMHESEDETLANVREEARQRAIPWMDHYGVTPAGRVVVSNPSSETLGRSLRRCASPPTSTPTGATTSGRFA